MYVLEPGLVFVPLMGVFVPVYGRNWQLACISVAQVWTYHTVG